MAQRNPNGYGGIKKLSGKRRRPYAVVVTTKYDAKAKDISFLQEALGNDLFAEVKEKYEKYVEENIIGGQVQKCIGYYETKPEALIALAEYNKNPFDIDKRNTTFGQIYEILYNEKFSKMKKSAKSSYVSSYAKCGTIKNIRMIELRKSHMQRIVDEHAEMSSGTLNNILGLFHQVYKFALENDICEKDYSQFVTAASEQETEEINPFTSSEVQKLWDNLDNYDWLDSILFMIYTGMRNGEMRKIRKDEVHLEERYIEVKGTKTKAADRIVPIHKKIAPLIEKRLAEGSDWLFPSTRGNPISYDPFRKRFDAILEELNCVHKPHDCRKTFATFAAASKLQDVYIKKIIGHKNQDITKDVYTHAFTEDLIKEIDKFEIK